MPNLKSFSVNLSLPGGLAAISGTWEPDDSEQKAAWEMYVELVTRVAVVELRPDEGLLREALSSLYTIFGSTRDILRKHGSGVAQPKGAGTLSFGYLSVTILNVVLRPVLAKWHPLLLDYESTKDRSVSPLEHERRWDKNEELRTVLEETRNQLLEYANVLGNVAGVPPLIKGQDGDEDRGQGSDQVDTQPGYELPS